MGSQTVSQTRAACRKSPVGLGTKRVLTLSLSREVHLAVEKTAVNSV